MFEIAVGDRSGGRSQSGRGGKGFESDRGEAGIELTGIIMARSRFHPSVLFGIYNVDGGEGLRYHPSNRD